MAIGLFQKIIKSVTGYNLTDPTSGLQGMNRRAFTSCSTYSQFDITYPDINMVLQWLLQGFHVEEIPATMHERTAGVSMHAGIWKPIKYMIVMSVSTMNVLSRYMRTGKIYKKTLKRTKA